MSDLHIDDFYRDVAKILVSLYSHFPRATTLYVEDISGPDTPDEFGLHSPRHESCFHTILWLASTGYISHGALVRQEGTDTTVLSHQAFLLLNSATLLLNSPTWDDSTQGAQPSDSIILPLGELVIHRLRLEIKHGTSDSLARLMLKVMSKFTAL